MGITGRAWRKLAMAAAVPGVALGTLAGFSAPAMAGTAKHQAPSHGTETFHAYGAGLGGNLPIYASGLFSDSGHIYLSSGGPDYTLYLHFGSLYVHTYHDHYSSHIASQSCNAAFTVTFDYHITGGTGRYDDVWGAGEGRIRVSAVLFRHNGVCQISEPVPGTVRTLLDASGPFAF
jgi:hypothetical protein